MDRAKSVGVIGAGIIGITNAIYLQQNGFPVTVLTKEDPLKTNSDAAVATWYAPDDSPPTLQRLCIDSLGQFRALAKEPASGVQIIKTVYYFSNTESFKSSAFSKEELKTALKLEDVSLKELDEILENKDFPRAALARNKACGVERKRDSPSNCFST